MAGVVVDDLRRGGGAGGGPDLGRQMARGGGEAGELLNGFDRVQLGVAGVAGVPVPPAFDDDHVTDMDLLGDGPVTNRSSKAWAASQAVANMAAIAGARAKAIGRAIRSSTTLQMALTILLMGQGSQLATAWQASPGSDPRRAVCLAVGPGTVSWPGRRRRCATLRIPQCSTGRGSHTPSWGGGGHSLFGGLRHNLCRLSPSSVSG